MDSINCRIPVTQSSKSGQWLFLEGQRLERGEQGPSVNNVRFLIRVQVMQMPAI